MILKSLLQLYKITCLPFLSPALEQHLSEIAIQWDQNVCNYIPHFQFFTKSTRYTARELKY